MGNHQTTGNRSMGLSPPGSFSSREPPRKAEVSYPHDWVLYLMSDYAIFKVQGLQFVISAVIISGISDLSRLLGRSSKWPPMKENQQKKAPLRALKQGLGKATPQQDSAV